MPDKSSAIDAWSSAISAAPVITSTSPPTAAWTAATRSACDHTCVGGDGDRVRLAGRRQQLGGRGIGEQHGGRAGRRVGGAERGDAGDRELPRRALGEHGRDVTRLVAGLVGARLVDDDLVVVGRRDDRSPARTG